MYKYAKEDSAWEGSVHSDGDVVVSIDTTPDEALISAGKCRELITNIQKLRKSAGLVIEDKIEAFYDEVGSANGGSMFKCIAANAQTFENKFKGMVPLPRSFANQNSVVLDSTTIDVDGVKYIVEIRPPAVAINKGLEAGAVEFLSTYDVAELSAGLELACKIDDDQFTLTEGKDFFLSATALAKANNAFLK